MRVFYHVFPESRVQQPILSGGDMQGVAERYDFLRYVWYLYSSSHAIFVVNVCEHLSNVCTLFLPINARSLGSSVS